MGYNTWPTQIEDELRQATGRFQADPVCRSYAATEEGRDVLAAEGRVMQVHGYDIVGQRPVDGAYGYTYAKRARPTNGRNVLHIMSDGVATMGPPAAPSVDTDWGKVATVAGAVVLAVVFFFTGAFNARPKERQADGGGGGRVAETLMPQLVAFCAGVPDGQSQSADWCRGMYADPVRANRAFREGQGNP